jgi:hypothetical protein
LTIFPIKYNILVISWRSYDEGNRSPQRKPLTCRKPMTNFITWCCIAWAGIRTHAYIFFIIQWLEFKFGNVIDISIYLKNILKNISKLWV